MECFGSLKDRTDIQRVVFALLTETAFTFFKGRTEKRVSVGSQDDFPGLEVKCDDGHELLRYWESVNNGIGDVLILHDFKHRGNHHLSGRVVTLAQL